MSQRPGGGHVLRIRQVSAHKGGVTSQTGSNGHIFVLLV